jgi:hypothetical protein
MTAPQPPVGPPPTGPGQPPTGQPSFRTSGQASVPAPPGAGYVSPIGSPTSGAPAAPPVPRRKGGLAALIAVVAVLLSLASLGIAAWALHRANVAVAAIKGLAGSPGPVTTQAGDTPTGDPAPKGQSTIEPPGGDPTSTATQAINPEASFAPAYQNENLKVQVNQVNDRTIDLDQPSVDGEPDITLEAGPTVAMKLSPGVTAAAAENGAASPKDCLRQIQLSAVDPAVAYPLRQGQAFCILTSLGAAQSVSGTQKMVVLTIAGISDDRVVSITATAYVVPR